MDKVLNFNPALNHEKHRKNTKNLYLLFYLRNFSCRIYKRINKMIDNETFIVGIGASAGGLEAIQNLFDHIPNNTSMSFIIIQHLSPDFKSLMPELLSKHTKMEIFTAENEQIIRPNCIYLNQRNKNLQIKDHKFQELDRAPKTNLNLPIDIFFHSLGEEYKDKAIGVILSGTGSDGSRGIKTIKEEGGIIIVQDPKTTQFDGMPNMAIATNLVDYVLSPKEIATEIYKIYQHTESLLSHKVITSFNKERFHEIKKEIYEKTGVNFQGYKESTLLRRLEKRMLFNNITHLDSYLDFLRENTQEAFALKKDFLIQVTNFFRDQKAFEILKEQVIHNLLQTKNTGDTIRVWVPGCSTGEEAYTIAMILDDCIQSTKRGLDFKIFATDLEVNSLEHAGYGEFHANIVSEIEPHYLEKYFFSTGSKYHIIKRLREKITFSTHDLAKDTPFVRIDLISCRNLLIYLNSEFQKKIFSKFLFSLYPKGYLFLGPSESVTEEMKESFRVLDHTWRIYQSNSINKPLVTSFQSENKPKSVLQSATSISSFTEDSTSTHRKKSENFFYKSLSDRYSPDCIYFNKNFDILFTKGKLGKYLDPQEGIFQNNLLNILNNKISEILPGTLDRLEENEEDVMIKNVVNQKEGEVYTFDLTISKFQDTSNVEPFYLMAFSEERKTKLKEIEYKDILKDNTSEEHVKNLKKEIERKNTEQKILVEELQSYNEELQSSNEELQSSNEELQSTNEELQSVNEELTIANEELQQKNRELEILRDDINNFLNSTEIGTLFLDTKFRIRRYTPAIVTNFGIRPEDIGQTISHFLSNFGDRIRKNIFEKCKKTLYGLDTFEEEIVDDLGQYYYLKISPFITTNKLIDGIVISFVDINKLKQSEKQRIESQERYRTLFENLNEGFAHAKIITDNSGKPINWEYITVNFAFESMTGLKRKNVIGKRATQVFPEIEKDPANWIEKLGYTALTGKDQYINDYSISLDKFYSVHVFCPKIGEFAITFTDVTEMKKVQKELIEAKQKAEIANHHKDVFLANMSHEIRTPLNSVIGFSEILFQELDNEKHKNYLSTIASNGKALLNIINDILDISKIEAGKLAIIKRECNIQDILDDLDNIFRPLLKKKKQTYTTRIFNHFPQIKIDDVRLNQILLNLIGNAVKFTEENGHIWCYIKILKSYDSKIDFKIKVADTGIGIEKSQLEIIFDTFTQQIEQDKRFGGTGLGLTITKRVVELMGGKIKVKSKSGKGSIFSVYFYGIQAIWISTLTDKPEDAKDVIFSESKILVIDDIRLNIEVLKKYLKNQKNIKVYGAVSYPELLSILEEIVPDLFIIDLKMPKMDGIKVINEIRKIDHLKSVPAICYTASAYDSRVKDFDSYIIKPVQKSQLTKELKKFLIYKSKDENEPNEIKKTDQDLLEDYDKLSKIQKQEITTKIQNESFIQKIEDLIITIFIDDISKFNKKLLSLSSEYDLESWIEKSIQLQKYLETFEYEDIEKSLHELKELFTKIL